MKYLRNLFFILISTLSAHYISNGQQYLEMINDPESNYFDIQKAANEYFDNVGTGKGTGYNQYKRWEYENRSKCDPSGRINNPGPIQAKKEFEIFKAQHPLKSAQITNWESLGPDNTNSNNGHYSPGLGRVDRIAVNPDNDKILFIGGPTNGVWKSVDGGLNWISKTDNIGALGVSSIVIDPQNTNHIFWSTGDGDNNSTNCTGIYISPDAGETWSISGLSFPYTNGVKGRKLIMNPNNNQILLFSCSKGIYKTTDGGDSWNLKTNGNFDDLFYKPGNPEIVYASKVGEFYRSSDGGESFAKVDISLSGRVFISVTPAAPEFVYLMSGRKGIYKSTDSGQTFTYIADHKYTKGEMWHHGTFIVNPSNPDIIHTGEYETHKSTDGGYSWTKTSVWTYPNNHYIHCDIHDFVYAGDKLYVCTDGGVSVSENEGANWINLFNTMVALEPYRMTVCKSNSNLHMNGSQDNGIYLWDGSKWDGIFGADGMECLIDYINPNNKYYSIQNGSVYAVGRNVAQPGEGDWVSPMVMHPVNPEIIYFGGNNVYKTEDGMNSWTSAGSFGNGNVNMLAISESNPDYIYASKSSKIWKTVNGGKSWVDISAGLPNYFITRIALHPLDPLKIAVSVGGYAPGTKVYTSTDGGKNWENHSINLPNIEARCLAYDDSDNDALYLGMDIGIFYTDNTQSQWEPYSDGFPMIGVNDIKIHYSSDQIFAASLGRGIWKNSTKNASPFCEASGSEETTENWIKNVQLESLNHSSEQTYYENHKNLFARLETSLEYTLKVTLNNHSESDKCFAWIDSNNNRIFENSEIILFNNFDENHTAVASVQIPPTAEPGFYTMRIRHQINNNSASPCGNDIKGEVEDYSVLFEKVTLEYCNASGTDGTTSDWIKNVTISTLNNSSDKSSYSDFTNLSVDLKAEEEYTCTVTLNYHWDADDCGIWVDYNQNYEFEENEFVKLPITNSTNHIYEGKFTVPASAKAGKTRMRVRAVYNASLNPCSSLFGEVEDYSIMITNTTPAITISNKSEDEIRVYPNPAGQVLNIEWFKPSEKSFLYVFNVNGDLVYEKNTDLEKHTKVDTRSYSPGLYFVKIKNRNKTLYSRFVVQ